jgi:Tfp pilus assembly protein PilV
MQRAGFTLVEVIVALVLFQFGMLALAATSAVAARELAVARHSARARAVARDRVESFRAISCPSASFGTVTHPGGLTESWRVEAVGLKRLIADSLEYALPRGQRGHFVLRTATICTP